MSDSSDQPPPDGAPPHRPPAGGPPPPPRFGPRTILGLAIIVGFVALVAYRLTPFQVVSLPPPGAKPPGASPPALEPLPEPRTDEPAAVAPGREDFVDSAACAGCHAVQHQSWRASTHARAGGRADRSTVIAPFGRGKIRFRDAVVTPAVSRDGRYTFSVARQGLPDEAFTVDFVVGGGHMVGGGTQTYFSKFPDGTVRFLPFDWSRHGKTWFCQRRERRGGGWSPIGPEVSIGDCSNWPPSRVLGSHARFPNCQQCHGSQIDLVYDDSARRYATHFSSLAINCESCHGPGRRHVELARSGRIGAGADIGLPSLATLDKRRSVEVCLRCHAVKRDLPSPSGAGRPAEHDTSVKLPVLSSRPLMPDGRVRTFAYQEQHLYSDCYVNGSMTCTSCHDPHGQGYRDVAGTPLAGRFDDRQCTGCHASKTEAPERHSHHEAGSPGSRCVACHMPYLQEPEVGGQIRYARSDHTISIPRPGLDAALGLRGACQACHPDWAAARLDEQVTAWYGALKPHRRAIQGALAARNERDRLAASRLLLVSDGGDDAMLRFAGLAAFSLGHLTPDMPALEPEIVARLREIAQDRDVDLRALALASLHLARGRTPDERAFIVDSLGKERNEDAALRRRWAWILNLRGEDYLRRGEPAAALSALRGAIEVLPDAAAAHRNLGLVLAGQGAQGDAVARLHRAHELDPADPLTLLKLAEALVQAGDHAGAQAVCEKAIAKNPHESAAHFALGKTRMAQGLAEPAALAFERALAIEPGLAPAHFALAAAHDALARPERARAARVRGLELDRVSPEARAAQENLRAGIDAGVSDAASR